MDIPLQAYIILAPAILLGALGARLSPFRIENITAPFLHGATIGFEACISWCFVGQGDDLTGRILYVVLWVGVAILAVFQAFIAGALVTK